MSASGDRPLDDTSIPAANTNTHPLLALSPAFAAISYPFLLQAFHRAVTGEGDTARLLAPLLLLLALLMPAWGFALALRWSKQPSPSRFQLGARTLAYISVATPPLFVFIAFLLNVLGHPLPEPWAWIILWSAGAAWVLSRRRQTPATAALPNPKLRVVHGAIAALLIIYILFHLANHLFGLIGPQAHADVMKLGRAVYRARLIEPLLVALLLLQVISGGWLALRWGAQQNDGYRVFQIASGTYLWFFILTHMNSALVSARAMQHIDTNWAWASGAPTGLIMDAWNIRLLPHYALGVFFVLAHLASGLRVVLIAHGVNTIAVNRAWIGALVLCALISVTIMSGLCGLRL